jgi:ketopantoate reductase
MSYRNAVWSVLCALARLPVSGIVAPDVRDEIWNVARKTMEEVLAVARALGYGEDVLPAAAVDRALKVRVWLIFPFSTEMVQNADTEACATDHC